MYNMYKRGILFMEEKMHNITLEDRKKLSVTKVCEVLSFNENEVALLLSDSKLTIKGSGLRVCEVSSESGDVVITGESIDNILYSRRATKSTEGVIRRLLK